jgi:protein SCO1
MAPIGNGLSTASPARACRPTGRLFWLGVGLTVALLLLASLLAALKARIASGQALPVYGAVADFVLTNQAGRAVTRADLRGQVWVADIIFTRCAGPCPTMTRQMKALQQALPASGAVKLVTLTTDPDFDTPPVLRTYAERFGADANRWLFLTGTKPQIANLAVDSLKLTAVETKPEERQSMADLFIHSTLFVVVDKNAQLRGIFELSGEGIDPRETQIRILAAVRRLERER